RHTRCYRDWSSDVCSSDLEVLELIVPSRAQIGTIELEQETGAHDGGVFTLQHVGQRMDVRFVARVVAVHEEAGGLTRRHRGHEEDSIGAGFLGGSPEVVDVLLDRAEVAPGNRARTG